MQNLSQQRYDLLKTFKDNPTQFYPETIQGKIDFQILHSYGCIERNGDRSTPFTITESGKELLDLVK